MAYRETYEEHEKRVARINRSGPPKCKFFQRGQCYKENCEFSHTLHGSTISKTPCRNYQVFSNNKSKSLPDFSSKGYLHDRKLNYNFFLFRQEIVVSVRDVNSHILVQKEF